MIKLKLEIRSYYYGYKVILFGKLTHFLCGHDSLIKLIYPIHKGIEKRFKRSIEGLRQVIKEREKHESNS